MRVVIRKEMDENDLVNQSTTTVENSSDFVTVAQEWNSSATTASIFLIVTVLVNGFVLSIFIRYSHLRTPFTVYLMNLLCSNLVLCSAGIAEILDEIGYPGFSDSFFLPNRKIRWLDINGSCYPFSSPNHG